MNVLFDGLIFTFTAFIILIILSFSHIFQKQDNSLRSKIYRCLMVIIFVMIITEFVSSYLLYDKLMVTLGEIMLKMHWFTGIAYMYMFSLYVYVYTKKIDSNKSFKNLIFKEKKCLILTIICTVVTIFYFFTQFNLTEFHYLSYLPGMPAYVVYVNAVICVLFLLIDLIKSNNKNDSFFAVIALVLGLADYIVQMKLINIACSPLIITFMQLTNYFIIENPSLSLSKELEKKNEIIENGNNKNKILVSNKANELLPQIQKVYNDKYTNKENNLLDEEEQYKENLVLFKTINELQNIFDIIFLDNYRIQNNSFRTRTLFLKIYDYISNISGNKKVKVVFDIDSSTPSVLNSDKNLIYQIILCSLLTSLSNTDVGKIVLKVKYLSSDSILNVKISDSGNGMSKEKYDTLMNHLNSIDKLESIINTDSNLILLKKYVTFLNGNLSIDSTECAGTIVNINIPCVRVGNENLVDFKVDTNINYIDLSNKNILIIDNNHYNVVNKLKKYNIKPIITDNVKDGFNEVKKLEINYDFIIVNPDLSSENLVSCISDLCSNLNIKKPVFVSVTTDCMIDSKKYYLDYGYDYYLMKPIDIYDLDKMLNQIK